MPDAVEQRLEIVTGFEKRVTRIAIRLDRLNISPAPCRYQFFCRLDGRFVRRGRCWSDQAEYRKNSEQKTVHDVCTKTVWKADDVHKTAMAVRQYKERLGYSEQWMTDYVYNIVLLAKKEPKRKNDDTETKK